MRPRDRSPRRLLAPLLAALPLLGGCSHATLDRGAGYGGKPLAASDLRVEDVPVFGHTVIVRFRPRGKVEGELLAVKADRLVLRVARRRVEVLHNEIDEVGVVLYPAGAGWLALWTVLGGASTVSHGLYLLITAPVIWAGGGGATAATAGLFNKLWVKRADVARLYQYARYPAGMPVRAEPEELPPATRPATRPASRPASGPASTPASLPGRDTRPGAPDEPGVSP